MNLKGQSQIISTVLLILISITAIVVVSSFVIPFIKKQLSGTECLDVYSAEKLGIQNKPQFTCYDGANMRVQIHLGDVGNSTKGFQISLEIDGATEPYRILRGSQTEGVSLYKKEGEPIKLPPVGGERTYVISGVASKPDSVSVYPILESDKVCGASDSLTSITPCPM